MLDSMTTDGCSGFRSLFEQCLGKLQGRRVEWPQMMRAMLSAEFERVRGLPGCYQGKQVFIDRDSKARNYEQHDHLEQEKLQVYRLFRQTHMEREGVLKVAEQGVWLVSCEVPNQGKHSGRRADLLGVREDGSLVVFECKIASNRSDSPIKACLEGLDYLAHLLRRDNFVKLNTGYRVWREKLRNGDSLSRVPDRFRTLNLDVNAKHAVFVLAPKGYFNVHRCDSSKRQQGWELLSDRQWPTSPIACELDFVVSDFSGLPASMVPLDG